MPEELNRNHRDYFDFKEYKECFQLFYKLKAQDDAYILTMSSHHITSGYWIEREPIKHTEHCVFYRTIEDVKRLEQLIDLKEQIKSKHEILPDKLRGLIQ